MSQGSYFGDGNGGGAGPGSPNNLALQMGISYGQSILQQGLRQGEQSFTSSYLPAFTKLQRYFCVDNTYVRKKLGILLFPFVRKFPPPVATDASGGIQDSQGFGNGLDDGTAFSPSYGSPTVDFPASSSTTGFPATGTKKPGSLSPLPTQDSLSFDLYIPMMGAITYVIISAFLYGVVHKGSVKSDYLLSTTSVVAFWLAVEIVAVKLLAYLLRVVHGADFLDVVSLCGYKYPVICLILIIRQVVGLEGSVFYLPLVAYAVASVGFFTVRSVVRFSTRGDGRVPPRARLLAYISALVQLPGILWLCFRPFV